MTSRGPVTTRDAGAPVAADEPRQGDASGDVRDAREAGHSSAAPDAPARNTRSIDSATLFGGADELHITHGDARYRLKRTLLGKLILTK